MLTTDPIYYKPLLPVISIYNTANSATLYTYSAFTGIATGTPNVFPIYCSVNLSQNTHGEFFIQFEDQTRQVESSITVGSRVVIECGKQSTSTTRLISGIVRRKGYYRGADKRLLYTISGSSLGIRLNELVTYVVSEAKKTSNMDSIDMNDPTRKADILLENLLGPIVRSDLLGIDNLANNSDVETFIPSLAVEFGELQDLVNLIEDQSGGEIIVDTQDLVNFRHQIKNNLFGKGFTIKNKPPLTSGAIDDADDTMYLRGKDWNYEDSFYKSDAYANKVYGILPAGSDDFSTALALGYDREQSGFGYYNSNGAASGTSHEEWGLKFRPSHTHYISGDLIFLIRQSGVTTPPPDTKTVFRIIKDSGGIPMNSGGTAATITFDQFASAGDSTEPTISRDYSISVQGASADFFNLDTTKDYWIVLADVYGGYDSVDAEGYWSQWNYSTTGRRGIIAHRTGNSGSRTSNANGGSGWSVSTGNRPCFEQPITRSQAFIMWDPKAIQAVGMGRPVGLPTESVLTDAPVYIKTKEAMYPYLSQQLYEMARPRTMYNFPAVTAPNIPVFPGDPIVISDSVLDLSTIGNRVTLTTCGDMNYTWGALGVGDYQAPTVLSINAIGVHQRYR